MDATNRQRVRNAIVASMRRIAERDGIRATSIAKVTRDANITRELFYYYFNSKDDAIDALIDDYIDECLDCAKLWAEARSADSDCCLDLVIVLRRILYDGQGNRRPIHKVLVDLDRDKEVRRRAVERVVNYIASSDTYKGALSEKQSEPKRLLTFMVIATGELLELYPEANDECVAALLHDLLS